ncbi:Type I Iterative PKS [Diaporthe australafricana]|uniref:Type I Iterative PKS n=1 Tax=Diaporthe australafricana TaxID=127596 RepID=A0ABR3WPM2_9PEZI
MACKSIKSGDATCALVTGSNLLLDPAIFQLLSDQKFLSPDGVCYSFDHRANGYARGEGIVALVLKPVAAAIRDGDMIRAVIRSIGSNQDGRSPVLAQPSPQAQEDLIRHVYKQANLSLAETRYVEAHGTGTPVGDPIEMKAIGRVFRKARSAEEPLYVGSVKTNIGHLEGASALASIIKSILILEKGVIPPNALFEKINPDIDVDFYHTEIPTESVVWPASELRRVSVNSFGFGGSNTHVVLDDAYHYLKDRCLPGNHCTSSTPGVPASKPIGYGNGTINTEIVVNGNGTAHPLNGLSTEDHRVNGVNGVNGSATKEPVNGLGEAQGISSLPKMIVWTAADENAVKRTVGVYQTYYQDRVSGNPQKLGRLAQTLASRRSQMLWRTFAIVADGPEIQGDKTLSPAKPVRSSADAGLAFVFTGQGAQYADMGRDLGQYPVFSDALRRVDDIYASLGCTWSIFDELCNSENINKPEYAQPLSTAIQLALIELLKSFRVKPKAVVGHSSGEIAAAYATGALNLISACKVSYYRGRLAGKLRSANSSCPGAMISVNLSEDQVPEFLESVKATGLCVACINSPLNCTLSGPEASIDAIKTQADKIGVFAQKLKTGVAYHSPSMLAIADEYLSLMGNLESAGRNDAKTKAAMPMVSSVTGKSIRSAELAKGQYWVDNMVSPVRFADAVQVLTQESAKLKVGLGNITDLVEVGPHPALRRPISDTINQEGNRKKQIRYWSALHRSRPPIQTTLELMGQLFCYGHAVSVSAVNQHSADEKPAFLVDCPEYPFDHSNKYWAESRISRDYRLRGAVKGETLGVRVSDWNELEPRWRNFLSIDSVPFTGHHMISDTVVYPAAGMLIMAIEAVQQMVPADRVVAGFFVKEATFISPIIIEESWEDRTETSLTLRQVGKQAESSTQFETTIYSYRNGQWTECSRARISIDYADSLSADDVDDEKRLAEDSVRRQFHMVTQSCDKPVDSNVHYSYASDQGLQYGDWFSILQDIHWDNKLNAVGRVDVSKGRYQTSSLVHPAVLDTAFHILRVSAGSQPAANVPVRLENAWFASSGWQHPQTNFVKWMANSNSASDGEVGRGEQGKLHALSDDGKVLCTIQKAVTAAVTTGAQEKETRLLYGVEWKPQLSLLEPKQLSLACRADSYTRDETVVLASHAKMCSALDLAAARTLKGVDHAKVPEGLVKHVEWMQHHVSNNMSPEARQEAETLSASEVEARLSEVDSVLPAWKLYTECARKLPEMLSGDLDPLQVVFGSDLASIFYEDLFLSLCSDGRLGRLLDLASHENPALRFLEVGAGTGGMTGHIIKALQEREARTGSPSFSEYTYTDISPAFFERAKGRWPDLQDRMTFKTLDLDRSIDSQGFETGSYDYIVAASVLHATPHLEENIRSICKALKPGGRLVLLEVINPDDIATNFMAGLVPGWWVAREEWRPHSAAIPEDLWDTCLRRNGFSGNDVVIRDYENDKCHIMSIIVSTAAEQTSEVRENTAKCGKVVLVVGDKEQGQERELVDSIRGKVDLGAEEQATVCPFNMDGLEKTLVGLTQQDTVICLAEANKPLLANLTEEKFSSFQYLIKNTQNILWVTTTSIEDSQYPNYSIMQGFFRTIRAEQPESHIVTLAIEGQPDAATCASFIQKVLQSAFGPQPSEELEYVVNDGHLTTGRAIEDVSGNGTLRSLLSRLLQRKAWAEGPALQLSVGTLGSLDTLRFVQDFAYEAELGPLEVEIVARAWGLINRDLQAAMGRLDNEDGMLGGDCAGVVTRVGSDCNTSFKPGERVWMMASDCTRQYPRADIKSVVKIPDSMSFETITSICVPTMTAYQALVEIGRLEGGDRVLIHSAADVMGQVAVQVARMQGAEVFATASTPEKRLFLTDRLSIAKDHIFSSETTSFAQGVMRITGGEGVDVVYNSLPGDDALRASCECMARNGRLVQIGQANTIANATFPMATLARNVSFSAVDVTELSPKVAIRLLKKTMQLLEEEKIQLSQPLQVFNASGVEEAFKQLQSGNSLGRVIIAPKPEDVVPQFTQEHRPWTFDENASCLIAGGSGGLGRAILNWMADRGAKHLIVPSRSGASSKAAADMIAQLQARGVTVVAPQCDVSDAASLGSLLDECSDTLPPIKGCINGAMVLQDAIMANMTFAQWDLTMKSKVQTSWNLHRLLPKDMGFFILLASLAGVAGQMASANYAGGCTFQDALARYRVAQGHRAISLDIGWMRNVGIIAENPGYQRQRQSLNDMNPIDDTELLAVLTLACDPQNPLPTPTSPRAPGQVLFGLRTPAENMLQGLESPAVLDRPLFAGFSFIPGGGGGGGGGSEQAAGGQSSATAADQGAGALFRQAGDSGERVQIVLRALSAKLARAMSISPDDVEPGKALWAYGVDSLMAVELRNWIGREFGAAVAVFDIMGGVPIASVADLVTARSGVVDKS